MLTISDLYVNDPNEYNIRGGRKLTSEEFHQIATDAGYEKSGVRSGAEETAKKDVLSNKANVESLERAVKENSGLSSRSKKDPKS